MSKDWTGNKRSVFATIGASNHSDYERAENDYYATSPIAIDKLASKFEIPSRIWEPACGEGHLSKRLIELGHDVFSTDLINRGYGTQLDFLSLESYNYKDQFPCILTNPPYKYVTEFILRTMELLPEDGYGIFLLKTTALESKKRYEKIYKHTPPLYLFQFIERLQCARNGDFEKVQQTGGSAASYAWFVFRKGNTSPTQIYWI
jgi:hypothetical protein